MTTVYDVVKDTQTWIEREIGLGCCFTHLIFATIYNSTERERGQHKYTSKTTIKEIITRLTEIGYSEQEIRNKLFDLLKKDDSYLGLIETSRYFNINTSADISNDDGIWLTPRSAFICDLLGLKFLYMIALYKLNRIKDRDGKIFDYQDKLPLSLNNIATNLYFLCKIAATHLVSLQFIKKKLSNKTDWFNYYRRWYCIKVHNGEFDDQLGDLLLNNILRSHIKFLNHQRTISPYEYITDKIILQYKKLSTNYKNFVLQLCNNSNIDYKDFRSLHLDLQRGMDWGVFASRENE